jgi:general secretion pathway protein N
MSRLTWILLLASFLTVLIVNAPASLLGSGVIYTSNGRVELANAQGTLWHGSANPLIHQHNDGLLTLDKIHWNIEPWALLAGKLSALLNWENQKQSGPMSIVISSDEVELKHAYIPLPAVLLDEASDFLKPAALGGQIIVTSDSLHITKQGAQGTAFADWINASSLLSTISPLGDYHFIFASTAAGTEITLSTISGPLQLAGGGHYSLTTGLDFKGTAQASSGSESKLKELLSHLGPQERPGVNTFSLVPQPIH